MTYTNADRTSGPCISAGEFGRMFGGLPPWRPPGNTDHEELDYLRGLALTMVETAADEVLVGGYDNPDIPAGYTYFAQFVAHDLTSDPSSSLQRLHDPRRVVSYRTPRVDLDSLYGRGPERQGYLFEADGARFRIGRNQMGEHDLPRVRMARSDDQAPALIGDACNDENVIISQVHLAMLKLHNLFVDRGADFASAQRLVRWHYQWVVVHDLARRLCGDVVDDLLTESIPDGTKWRAYQPFSDLFLPVEFALAVLPAIHSMVRPAYHLNDALTACRGGRPIPTVADRLADPAQDSLRGCRELPAGWSIDWERFTGSGPVQLSRRLDTRLAPPVGTVEPGSETDSLAFDTMLRGLYNLLPSGEAVAVAMDLEPMAFDAPHQTPLWRYVLAEAEYPSAGRQLGPVGARIAAEVLLGLVLRDSQSYLSLQPDWQPDAGLSFDLHRLLTNDL